MVSSELLPHLDHWPDEVFRTAAANMALDEALFEWSCTTGRAAARFYHWDHPARTCGYFDRRDPTGPGSAEPTVRRFTGGGLVEHGEDLTFVLAFPSGSAIALASASQRYRRIHEALAATLAGALASVGGTVALEEAGGLGRGGPCFAHPVPWDLLDPRTGRKIGGGAQRRSRGAVIHQGSLRLAEELRRPDAAWIGDFLHRLARLTAPLDPAVRDALVAEVPDRVARRYGDPDWNRGRGFEI